MIALRLCALVLLLSAALPAAAAEPAVLPEPVPADWQVQAQLFGTVSYLPAEADGAVIAWTQANADALSSGFLFEAARRLLPADQDKALELYSLGMIRAFYDARRCHDRTAERAIGRLTRPAREVATYGHAHPRQWAAAGFRALERRGLFEHAVSPMWICSQGMSTVYGGENGTTAPAGWDRVAERVRSDFQRQFESMSTR
ncbi:MAG: hypothetical protein HY985_11130 [Magnetospirillum sp.]|nr:hypothetical protein [Magnetospirillum sp.]